MPTAAEEMLAARGAAAEAAAEAAELAMAPAAAAAMLSRAPTISAGVGMWSRGSPSLSLSIACRQQVLIKDKIAIFKHIEHLTRTLNLMRFQGLPKHHKSSKLHREVAILLYKKSRYSRCLYRGKAMAICLRSCSGNAAWEMR